MRRFDERSLALPIQRGAAREVPAPRRRRSRALARLVPACALFLAAACATATIDPQREIEIAAARERLEIALNDGDDAAARAAAARLRELAAPASDLARADEAVRLLDARIEPRLLPSFDALRAALASGDDDLARSVLRRLWSLRPTGAAAEMAAAFERVLRGREAVAGLDLRSECVWVADPAAPGAGDCLVRIAARARDGVERALDPGPATLYLTSVTIDAGGNSHQASEAHSFDALARVAVPVEGAVAIDLARVPLALAEGALALRLTADVRVTPGTVREDDAALPAQRVPIERGELVLLAGRLLALGPAAVDELAARAADPSSRAGDLLEVALRVRREDRARVLDTLCVYAGDAARAHRLAHALRWLAPDVPAGADPEAWTRWLAARGERLRTTERRFEPVLPREIEPTFADGGRRP